MLVNEAERREFQRLPLQCKIEYKQPGDQDILYGTGRNLSGSGISFTTDRAVTVGTELEIDVIPTTDKLQPLSALIKVVRMEPSPSARQFVIGGAIQKILS